MEESSSATPQPKPLSKSKTALFNAFLPVLFFLVRGVVRSVLDALGLALPDEDVNTITETIVAYSPELVALLLAAGTNLYLRFITFEPVEGVFRVREKQQPAEEAGD